MAVVVRGAGIVLPDRRPTSRRILKGYAASRQAYDARRRKRSHDPQTRAYVEILRCDPCGFCPPARQLHDQIAADHIVPLDAGGEDHWSNLAGACRACNASKSNHDLLRWLLERNDDSSEAPALDEARGAGGKVPADVIRRRDRGLDAIMQLEPLWEECTSFLDGDQYVERSAVNGQVQHVEAREGGSKPRWRPRTTRNRFTSALVSEAAIVSGRVPNYECVPLNGDPDTVAGARLGEKVLVGLYDSLRIGPKTFSTALTADTTGAGFAWPYWDSLVGDPVPDPEDPAREIARTGDIGIHLLGQHEVLWDPGVPFDDSRWYLVRKAAPIEHVKGRPDYTGPKNLTADAETAPGARRGHAEERRELVFVYHYLERPCHQHPRGRWMQFAGGEIIAPVDDYPSRRDIPVIHMLEWIPRPHRHRAMGLGEQLLDVQRTYNRTMNQIIAWINLVLNPQVMMPEGALPRGQQLTDEPGAVVTYRPVGGLRPEWRTVPEVPMSLFNQLDRCIADMQEITGQRELPAGIEAASAVQMINERDASRRAGVVRSLAAFHASLGRHLLALVQRHYTEQRLMVINGRFGVELIHGFLGAHIEGVLDVRVSEASIEPRTRAAMEAKIMTFADRGWITPHQAMAALAGGTAEALVDDFELDVAKQYREIRHMVDAAAAGPDGPHLDPVPIPGLQDNHAVHADVIKQWMKTRDFELESPEVQEAAQLHLEMHEMRLAEEQQRDLEQQAAAAEGLGRRNATRPGEPAGEASQAGLAANSAALGAAVPR